MTTCLPFNGNENTIVYHYGLRRFTVENKNVAFWLSEQITLNFQEVVRTLLIPLKVRQHLRYLLSKGLLKALVMRAIQGDPTSRPASVMLK